MGGPTKALTAGLLILFLAGAGTARGQEGSGTEERASLADALEGARQRSRAGVAVPLSVGGSMLGTVPFLLAAPDPVRGDPCAGSYDYCNRGTLMVALASAGTIELVVGLTHGPVVERTHERALRELAERGDRAAVVERLHRRGVGLLVHGVNLTTGAFMAYTTSVICGLFIGLEWPGTPIFSALGGVLLAPAGPLLTAGNHTLRLARTLRGYDQRAARLRRPHLEPGVLSLRLVW